MLATVAHEPKHHINKEHLVLPAWWNGRHKRLKISGLNRPCRFESGRGYQILASFAFKVKHTWLISPKNGTQTWSKRNSLGSQTDGLGCVNEQMVSVNKMMTPRYIASTYTEGARRTISTDTGGGRERPWCIKFKPNRNVPTPYSRFSLLNLTESRSDYL